jgi:hypothetical protein
VETNKPKSKALEAIEAAGWSGDARIRRKKQGYIQFTVVRMTGEKEDAFYERVKLYNASVSNLK